MPFEKDSRQLWRVRPWAQFHWLDHGFGSRAAGPWTPAAHTATLKQIHSDIIVRVSGQRGLIGEGDALITDEPGVHLAIRTADCVPILLLDPNRKVIAAVHAGWRGTAAQIATRTVERMAAEFGSHPASIHAAIGPCIQHCCYEVGPDVAARFSEWFPELATSSRPQRIDLAEANRRQLAAAGLTDITTAGACTQCVPAEFHSYRRDKEHSGRMVTGIAILTA